MIARPASKALPAKKSTAKKSAPKKLALKKLAPKKLAPTRKVPAGHAQPASCRFYLSEPLSRRVDAVLAEIDSTEDACEHRDALSAIVVELTNEGLDYYFTGSLVAARVGFIVQQSANLGLAGVKQVMAPVIKKVIARLDHEQLVSISGSIRTLMA